MYTKIDYKLQVQKELKNALLLLIRAKNHAKRANEFGVSNEYLGGSNHLMKLIRYNQ